MNSGFKQTLFICVIGTAFFVAIFLWAFSFVWKDSGKHLYAQRSSSLFFALLMSPLPIVYIALTVYEVVKHFQKKETRI